MRDDWYRNVLVLLVLILAVGLCGNDLQAEPEAFAPRIIVDESREDESSSPRLAAWGAISPWRRVLDELDDPVAELSMEDRPSDRPNSPAAVRLDLPRCSPWMQAAPPQDDAQTIRKWKRDRARPRTAVAPPPPTAGVVPRRPSYGVPSAGPIPPMVDKSETTAPGPGGEPLTPVPPKHDRIVAADLRLVRCSDGRVLGQASAQARYDNIHRLAGVLVQRLLDTHDVNGHAVVVSFCNRRRSGGGLYLSEEITGLVVDALIRTAEFDAVERLPLRQSVPREEDLENAKKLLRAENLHATLAYVDYLLVGGIAAQQPLIRRK